MGDWVTGFLLVLAAALLAVAYGRTVVLRRTIAGRSAAALDQEVTSRSRSLPAVLIQHVRQVLDLTTKAPRLRRGFGEASPALSTQHSAPRTQHHIPMYPVSSCG